MSKASIKLGRAGEQSALDFLKHKGYKIISTNYRSRLGQIDIIAKERNVVCFIEVKTRTSVRFGQPDEAVGILKQRKMSELALAFLKENKLLDYPARFDVVSVLYSCIQPKIKIIKNAFELDCRYLY